MLQQEILAKPGWYPKSTPKVSKQSCGICIDPRVGSWYSYMGVGLFCTLQRTDQSLTAGEKLELAVTPGHSKMAVAILATLPFASRSALLGGHIHVHGQTGEKKTTDAYISVVKTVLQSGPTSRLNTK